MGQQLSASDMEPLDFMSALIRWSRVDLETNPKGNWTGAMDKIAREVEIVTGGRFIVTMDREDEMTDDIAYYAIRCEDRADARRVVAAYEMAATLRPEYVERETPPIPDWLNNAVFKA